MQNKQYSHERPFTSRVILGESVTPAVARWFQKIGVVKTERSGGYLIIALTLIFFATAVYFYFFF